jgi:hypothetical protein
MSSMDEFDERLQTAAKKRARAKDAFDRADEEVRALLVEGRNEHDKGPSHMAKLTGFTREWVAKIAPDPKLARDVRAARNIAKG